MARKEPHMSTWPPGFTPQPPDPPQRHPLRYLRMRQTQLDNGVTGTMLGTFADLGSNAADPSKARLAVPPKRKRSG
jgi:hypothetical protein